MKHILYYILINVFISAITLYGAPPGGGYNGYRTFYATVYVHDPDGNPVSGVSVLLWAEMFGTEGNGSGTHSGTTNSSGGVSLSTTVYYQGYEDGHYMQVSISDERYTVLSASNTYSWVSFNLYPEFEVVLDLDQNGINDDWELPLAEKFCPSFKPHSTNKWIAPEPVEYLGVQKNNLWFYVIAINGQEVGDYPITDQGLFYPPISSWHSWINSPDPNYSWLTWDTFDYRGRPPGKVIGDYYLRFHYNYAGYINDPDGWSSYYQSERTNNNFRHTIYAHFFKNDNQYVVQYWIFYPYNDGYNNHEGDWEHINVIIDSQVPNEADIVRVDFYFHHKVQIRNYPDLEIESGTHPVIYVGGSGGQDEIADGGCYPEAGWWEDIGPLGYDEWVAGLGPHIIYSQFIDGNRSDGRGIVILPETDDIDYDQNPEMSWFKVKIPFGIFEADSPFDWAQGFLWPWTEPDVGNDAPNGPRYNAGWNKIGSVSGHYDLYTNRP